MSGVRCQVGEEDRGQRAEVSGVRCQVLGGQVGEEDRGQAEGRQRAGDRRDISIMLIPICLGDAINEIGRMFVQQGFLQSKIGNLNSKMV